MELDQTDEENCTVDQPCPEGNPDNNIFNFKLMFNRIDENKTISILFCELTKALCRQFRQDTWGIITWVLNISYNN